MLTGYCSFIGSGKEYEKSTILSDGLVNTCLKYKRIEMLANNLYCMVWNGMESKPTQDKEKYKLDLHYCAYLSRIQNNQAYEAFFMNKLEIGYCDN